MRNRGLAEDLLETMAVLFGSMRGGMAISVVIVGVLMGASTGIVGATVVTMGLLALPTMLRHGYKTELAAGAVISSGTLGQIIPPSLVLIVVADIIMVPVGDLFMAAVFPGLILSALYVIYIIVYTNIYKESGPPVSRQKLGIKNNRDVLVRVFKTLVPVFSLILLVLGSIIAGYRLAHRGGGSGGQSAP